MVKFGISKAQVLVKMAKLWSKMIWSGSRKAKSGPRLVASGPKIATLVPKIAMSGPNVAELGPYRTVRTPYNQDGAHKDQVGAQKDRVWIGQAGVQMPCLKIGQVGTKNGPVWSNWAHFDHVGALNYQIVDLVHLFEAQPFSQRYYKVSSPLALFL